MGVQGNAHMNTNMHQELVVSPHAARLHAQKNCLAVILALARTLRPEVAGTLLDRLERLRTAAERLVDLFNADLQELSGKGAAPTADVEVDVTALLDVVADILGDRAEAVNVPLVISCGGGGRVSARRDELVEALVNLVGNAIEASRPGCPVYFDASATPDGDHCWTIQDSAGGMPASVLDRIGAVTSPRRPGGAGFGVAIAVQTIRGHGGDVRFDSAPGRGTTVSIWLPSAGHRIEPSRTAPIEKSCP
jgi:signal transduction histidine kinase